MANSLVEKMNPTNKKIFEELQRTKKYFNRHRGGVAQDLQDVLFVIQTTESLENGKKYVKQWLTTYD
jgi:hypothetical protein